MDFFPAFCVRRGIHRLCAGPRLPRLAGWRSFPRFAPAPVSSRLGALFRLGAFAAALASPGASANGHGFGLHRAALAARELGGALTAHSDGPGHGATFILELPCKPATFAHENSVR